MYFLYFISNIEWKKFSSKFKEPFGERLMMDLYSLIGLHNLNPIENLEKPGHFVI